MDRYIISDLKEWVTKERRKPLLLRGARQVGKTWLVEALAKDYFDNLIKIDFEEYDNYSIIDVHSPDRIGMLYQITNKMNELGLVIYFAKIATKSDDVVDAFYVLDRNGNKITDSDHELITLELKLAIDEIL